MKKRGLLLTLTEPPPAMEEEFNAWYDQEHLPERLSIPGFRSARRWVAEVRAGEGKYLATYELDCADVLTSAAYLSFFKNPTPWTRRCLGKAVVFKRWVCEQIEPGGADPHPAAKGLLLNLTAPRVLQVRRFVAGNGEQLTLAELAEAALQEYSGLVYRLYKP